ncbi:MAG: nitrilase family protein [Flavobacteriales bacterium]|nr:nitrilase family protein [Flavobacteriales bacterium]|tara:strand:- start:8526 stop:9323 length:798 start_codon:yes stop_codon:yes gene_type:complete
MPIFERMKSKLNVSLVQSNIYWKDIVKNLSSFKTLVSDIGETDLILLPEMFNTAFCPEDNSLAESMDGQTVRWMKDLSKSKKCSVSGTLMIKKGEKVYNRLVWVNKNGDIYTYDKYHLFSLTKEGKYLEKGSKRLIIKEEGWKICPLICYDLRFPVFSRNNVDYDLLIYLANWPIKRIDSWDTLLKARSIENQCYTIGVNRIGQDGNGIHFNGHTKAFDAFGNKLISAKDNIQEVLQIEISLEDVKLKRRQLNFLQDRDDFTLDF